jgi:hypothetical protein
VNPGVGKKMPAFLLCDVSIEIFHPASRVIKSSRLMQPQDEGFPGALYLAIVSGLRRFRPRHAIAP